MAKFEVWIFYYKSMMFSYLNIKVVMKKNKIKTYTSYKVMWLRSMTFQLLWITKKNF